jgi:hypothetical protein
MRPEGAPVVLDHAGNALSHGLPHEDVEYSLEGLQRRTGREAPACKRCECGRVVPLISRVCDACGHEFWTVEQGPPEEVQGALVKAQPRQTRCAGWGETEGKCEAVPQARVFCPSRVRLRKGERWRCLSCARRKLHSDPEYLAKHADRARKLFADAKTREKADKTKRELYATPEYRKKASERSSRKYEDPEYRRKISELFANPEYRAKHADRARKRAKDPEWRANNAERLEKARAAKVSKAVEQSLEDNGELLASPALTG